MRNPFAFAPVVGLLVMLLAPAAVSAQMIVLDSYEKPEASDSYVSTNATPHTDTEGRQFTGYSGIGKGMLGGAPRTGEQFMFMENFNSVGATVTQTYSLSPGTYTLSYYEGGRVDPHGGLTYDFVVDGNSLGQFTTDHTGGAPTVLRSFSNVVVGPSGTTTIEFRGITGQSDNTGFFDDLTATVVPEPTSLAALLGLGGSLLLARRRR